MLSERAHNWQELSFLGIVGGIMSFFWAVVWFYMAQKNSLIVGAVITGLCLGAFGFYAYQQFLHYKNKG